MTIMTTTTLFVIISRSELSEQVSE